MTAASSSLPPPREGPGPLRVVVYACVPLVLLVVAAELVLAQLGVADPDERIARTRGFDRDVPYLVPDDSRPGAWRTRIYGQIGRELVIPPKGEATRVLLFGGSNTQGFPEERLAARLAERAPAREWEVYNLGRAGYGSERVAILIEQSARLEPDVVVIYSGHNEFVEAGFAMELAERSTYEGWQRLADLAMRLRLVTLMVSAFQVDEHVDPARPAPDRRRAPDSRFQRLTWDQTLIFLEAYRENLERMVAAARAGGAQVVLCTVIGNMLSKPYVATLPPTMTATRKRQFTEQYRDALGRVPPGVSALVGPEPVRLTVQDWGMAVGSSELQARRRESIGYEPPPLRPLSGPLADAPATRGAKTQSVEGAHWTDPNWWRPDVARVLDAVHALLTRELSASERERAEDARERLRALLVQAPDHPHVLFDLGLCTYLLGGDDERAVELLVEAGRFDRAPRRGNEATNAIVREVAGAHADSVELLDAEALFGGRTPLGLIGYEIMMDHCHIQPGARPVLMDDVAGAVVRAVVR